MRSLTARVAVGAGLVLAVFIALSAFALERAFRDSARSSREERLLAQVYLLMAAAEVDAQGQLTLGNGPLDPKLEAPGSGLYAVISDEHGRAVWRSHSALNVELPQISPLPPGIPRFDEVAEAGDGLFVQSFGVSWATAGGSYPFTFSVAEDLQPYQEQLNIYRRSLWGWLGAMALLLLVAQSLILRWGLSPLRHVADELTRLEQGQQEDIAGSYPTEVRRLTDNLNTLLTHERARQKRYRDALADLAHSLKTPLALVRGALSSARPEPELGRALEEQVEHMDRIVGYHLQRAAASGRSGLATPVPLRPTVERTLKAVTKVRAEKQIETEVAIDPGIRFRGDEGDLMELLGNVLDNACKWCRGRVRVWATLSQGEIALSVEDDGPGISEADAQRVLERGSRADQTVPGHGIGLAVTRDILDAYGGRILIARSALGGASVTLQLPGLS
jgi:two-component system, OmpR family, sensor histidine kinase PhoQ